MALLNIFFITFGLPKYFIFFFINIYFIFKKKIINFKNLFHFSSKNFIFIYIIFLFLIFFNNSLSYEFILENQYYIVFLSVIFYFNFSKDDFNIKSIFWYLTLLYFINIISLILFNNLILDCVISNNGFFDFFSKINDNYAILNPEKFNCNKYYQQGLLEHQSFFKFKIFIFLMLNSISFIKNYSNRKISICNLIFHVYLNYLVFSLSSRGLGFIFLITTFLLLFFLLKFKKKIYSTFIIISLIISTTLFYSKPIELVNIFFFKKLSHNQNHISRENLFQKIRLFNYDMTYKNKNKNLIKSNYLKFLYKGKGVMILESERWNEYKSFFELFYKIYFLNKKDISFNSYYHNYYFNEIAKFGLTAFLLFTYIFFIILKNIRTTLIIKKNDTLICSLIYLFNFMYISFFDAFLSGNLRNLILLIIILFILNNQNERKLKKI